MKINGKKCVKSLRVPKVDGVPAPSAPSSFSFAGSAVSFSLNKALPLDSAL